MSSALVRTLEARTQTATAYLMVWSLPTVWTRLTPEMPVETWMEMAFPIWMNITLEPILPMPRMCLCRRRNWFRVWSVNIFPDETLIGSSSLAWMTKLSSTGVVGRQAREYLTMSLAFAGKVISSRLIVRGRGAIRSGHVGMTVSESIWVESGLWTAGVVEAHPTITQPRDP